jgi:hypothetical protein
MNLVTLLSKLLTNAHVASSKASQKPDFKNLVSINEFHQVKFQIGLGSGLNNAGSGRAPALHFVLGIFAGLGVYLVKLGSACTKLAKSKACLPSPKPRPGPAQP